MTGADSERTDAGSAIRRLVISRCAAWLCLGMALAQVSCGPDAHSPAGSAVPDSSAGGILTLDRPRRAAGGEESDRPFSPAERAGVAADRAGVMRPPVRSAADEKDGPLRFTDVASLWGIDFRHISGMTVERYIPTANGSGVAIFDYDQDGRLDLYFANGTFLPVGSKATGFNRLYKNLGGGAFRDVTESSGLGFAGYCHGILAGDIDNDGDQDIFLCNYGPGALYLNNGDGTFREISKSAGLDRPDWTSSGAFLDYDNDGDLDLYVSNYGEWNISADDVFCGSKSKNIRLYCQPKWIRPASHRLYRNNGDHTFTDVTGPAGIGRVKAHGFGVVAADLNGDGRIDLYAANDSDPNFLFLNRGDGTFEDVTMTSGAGLSDEGRAQSGMGVDAEDTDGDGLPELFVTNFSGEYNTLYQNLGNGSFLDVTNLKGLAVDSLPWVGWGCALADFDNDGWPDCFVANGNIDDNLKLLDIDSPYAEPPLLYRNQDGKDFRLVSRGAGAYFTQPHIGHGAAFGDLDDDGDIDIVVSHKDGPPAVLRNDTPAAHRWIRLKLKGVRSNRDAIGARVEVRAGGRTIYRQRKGGTSLMSAHDPRLLIGLGPAREVETLTIRWPSGSVSVLKKLAPNQTYEIVEPATAGNGVHGVTARASQPAPIVMSTDPDRMDRASPGGPAGGAK
jgi:hypothetical protein